MTHTATFKKYNSKKVIGPRGGEKWETEIIEVVDTLHPVIVEFNGVKKTLYTRGIEAGKDHKSLYTETGDYARGYWQHGRYGNKMHHEPIDLYKGHLSVTAPYCSGQKIDQRKYLKAI